MTKETSLTYVKKSRFTSFINFIKSIFSKKEKTPEAVETVEIKDTVEPQKEAIKPKSKEEMLEIYELAKKGEYDLRTLSLEEMKILNGLIREEIKIKEEILQKTLASLD